MESAQVAGLAGPMLLPTKLASGALLWAGGPHLQLHRKSSPNELADDEIDRWIDAPSSAIGLRKFHTVRATLSGPYYSLHLVLQASRCEPRSATRYRLCHCPPKPHAASHAQPHATAWSCPASHSNLKKPTCAQRQRREHTNKDKSSRMTTLTTTPRWGAHCVPPRTVPRTT